MNSSISPPPPVLPLACHQIKKTATKNYQGTLQHSSQIWRSRWWPMGSNKKADVFLTTRNITAQGTCMRMVDLIGTWFAFSFFLFLEANQVKKWELLLFFVPRSSYKSGRTVHSWFEEVQFLPTIFCWWELVIQTWIRMRVPNIWGHLRDFDPNFQSTQKDVCVFQDPEDLFCWLIGARGKWLAQAEIGSSLWKRQLHKSSESSRKPLRWSSAFDIPIYSWCNLILFLRSTSLQSDLCSYLNPPYCQFVGFVHVEKHMDEKETVTYILLSTHFITKQHSTVFSIRQCLTNFIFGSRQNQDMSSIHILNIKIELHI